MNTIVHKELHNWWDGKVIIDEIREFVDDRGMLCELWRTDDDKMNTDGFNGNTVPQMSYWSLTKPFVVRGPHEHELQTDFFISFKTRMVYQLFNKHTQEMKFFVTDPQKIYRVKVAPPIIHSYRNIGLVDSITGNFPTALFMGKDKAGYSSTSKIDEIRHEESVAETHTVWVLGASGRLGQAITEKLYSDMGYHTYNVVPIYEKFNNDKEGMSRITEIFKHIQSSKTKDKDVIINCIAKTNVQDTESEFMFSNFLLSKYITEFAVANKIRLITFSTDYVFQEGSISPYTKSKLAYEKWIDGLLNKLNPELNINDLKEYVKIIRLSNLFSLKGADTHNVINKFWNNYLKTSLVFPKDLQIMPTSVEMIAEFISKQGITNFNTFNLFTNVSGKLYTIPDFMEIFATIPKTDLVYTDIESPNVINHPELFYGIPQHIMLDCDAHILNKFVQLKGMK